MTGDPTRDNKPDSHHFGGSDEQMEDEYAQHAREERERRQRERMDAAHEAAKGGPCSCWQQVSLHHGHCCFDHPEHNYVPYLPLPCGHTKPREQP